jgi:short-subunit dehydrogenase
LGEAFARALAARGINVLLVARREPELNTLAAELRTQRTIETRVCPVDLGTPTGPQAVLAAAQGLEVGLLVYNAAFSPIGPFLDRPLGDHQRALQVNCLGPLALAHGLGSAMAQRGRGGILLMSSLTAFQGSPYVSSYGATKAFNLALAEGLWFELSGQGVDVAAVCAGAVRTPGYLRSSSQAVPGLLEPSAVAERALRALGRGPFTIPGAFNRFASLFMRRLLPRRATVSIMGQQTRRLVPRASGV